MLKRTAVWAAALVLAISAGAVAASLWAGGSSGEPADRQLNLDEIPQDATATATGVSLTAQGAVFSGTETVVRVDTDVIDRDVLEQAADDRDVQSIGVAPDGFTGPFGGTTLATTRADGGGLVLKLPPLTPDGSYSGTVPLVITSLALGTPSGIIRVPGTWELTLDGPAAADLEAMLWREELTGTSLPVEGHDLAVTGVRSATETRVRVAVPDDVLVLSQLSIESDGRTMVPFETVPVPEGIEARFEATAQGSSLQVDLGELGLATSDATEAVTINVQQALDRADEGAEGEFAIDPGDIIDGRAGLVVSGQRGANVVRGSEREWVGIRVEGNWHPVSAANPTVTDPFDSPVALDQNGNELEIAHVEVGYTKDLGGDVQSGTTDIGVFLPDEGELTTLTLVLGPPTSVSHGPYHTELTPVE